MNQYAFVLALSCLSSISGVASAEGTSAGDVARVAARLHGTSPAPAQKQDDKKKEEKTEWEKLGERTVQGSLDRDHIDVGRADRRYKRIMIQVDGSSLEMRDIVVTFGDGSTFSPTVRAVFNQKDRSRVIDLPGDQRVIKTVTFKYGNLPGSGKARLELFGLR